ncbi:siderophore biosynthesis protein [Saccharopolyspora sp. HNM0983]|uniref:Siderophore biosynthesis protein n=1 Tax=Saccharopolyspora montiporae TaxID=2781240 RepID=A0A929FYL3_9PSEU|nr:IucA/IucC family protein [Saccharopolyspora sp. HNM0983]MBE9373494.1 siderophore biosynthesis protein [Saccharopolyspora sp. HNM0983]
MTTKPETDQSAVASPVDTAENASTDALLRCWVRENALPVGDDLLELDLAASGVQVRVPVLYHSPTGQHRFGPAQLHTGTPVGAVGMAALLALEIGGMDQAAVADLVGRVADSQQRIAEHVRLRTEHAADPPGTTPFLAAEQALLLGHPLHPAPKSRTGLGPEEARRYSPELRGSFALHWFAVDTSVLSGEGGAAERLAPHAPPVPAGTVPIPAHPWQAREVRSRPGIRRLLDAGLLHDLGASGEPWSPTASIRTVYRADADIMLKFSLGLPITNSVRENQRKELRRGAEIDRLLDAGLADEIARQHPGFGIVRDPAWLAVDVDDAEDGGLELVVRDNPISAADRAVCVAGLLAERPDRENSPLATALTSLAADSGAGLGEITEQWCDRYFDAVIAPVLWLYREYGLGLEAHQQNTLVVLDDQGWPSGGWYRDNQGYYLSAQRTSALHRFLPGVGTEGDNVVDEAVIDERLGYYIGINNLLGLIGALGAQGFADERRLLARVAGRLREFADLPLARTLAGAVTLRCKANLLTRADGRDELVGPLETQSVYCDIPNPFAEAVQP